MSFPTMKTLISVKLWNGESFEVEGTSERLGLGFESYWTGDGNPVMYKDVKEITIKFLSEVSVV